MEPPQNNESPLGGDDLSALHDLPDPNGPVKPVVEPKPRKSRVLRRVVGVGVGCVGVAILAPAFTGGTCSGATRTSRLEWQNRQAQIDLAIGEQTTETEAGPLPADHE